VESFVNINYWNNVEGHPRSVSKVGLQCIHDLLLVINIASHVILQSLLILSTSYELTDIKQNRI